jgi:hypothetical protein
MRRSGKLWREAGPMADGGKQSGEEKRRVYALFFCGALLIEVLLALTRDGPFRPTLIGTAVIITAALFFIYSWIRER